MSLLDWELTEERQSLHRALNEMCSRSVGSVQQTLIDAGIPWIGLPESAGGSGGDAFDAAIALQTLSSNSADAIGVDTGLVANWALARHSLSCDRSLIATAADPRNTLVGSRTGAGELLISGTAFQVPADERIKYLLLATDQDLALVSLGSGTLDLDENLAGEARATIRFENAAVTLHAALASDFTPIDLLARLALARAIQSCGAMTALRDLCVSYARTREQFGKPISDQQVIAHKLAEISELTLMTQAAVATALASETTLNCAIAKSVAGRCARKASMLAHQVHGAMGMSQEYHLGALTTRLWSWTEEAGRPEFWNLSIGKTFLEQPNPRLWDSIVNGMKGSNE
ncbi:MAG: hypothetical protein F2923_05910 [Actinobacteria bacterium]|uniref:Unannotated protein n=1 Tax=freshwater metagenome TaxID=449393 RepID=A0A6J7SJF7_9ZZZZ|nr:hypothetical protein [Actinomycetota bacterium]